MSLSSAQDERVRLCFHPYEANRGPELQETGHEAGLNFVGCYLDGVQAGKLTPLTLCVALKPGFFSVDM